MFANMTEVSEADNGLATSARSLRICSGHCRFGLCMVMSCAQLVSGTARSCSFRLRSGHLLTAKQYSWAAKHLFSWSICSRALNRAEAQGVQDWLGQFGSTSSVTRSSFYTKILQQTDLLRSHSNRSSATEECASKAESLAASSTDSPCQPLLCSDNIGNCASSIFEAASKAANAVLVQQHVQLPGDFVVPSCTTLPAYQLVGVFRNMLGWPNFPQAARASSLHAKWSVLQLTLLQAAGNQQGFAQQLQQLLDGVLLPHARQKLQKVQANNKIPEPNKLAAEQRYTALYATCQDTITRWAAATVNTPAFAQLQPAMLAVSSSMQSSLASSGWQCNPSSASSGKLMEETALAVLQASLPPNWSLLPTLHLLGADGETFQVQAGCKYEVDMLVLDGQGLAVGIVEVKLAAANPLMSLFNDVNALLRLVDQMAGKTITAITRSDLGSCPVAGMLLANPQQAGAAVTSTQRASSHSVAAVVKDQQQEESVESESDSRSTSSGASGKGAAQQSVFAKARATTLLPPFSESQAWQTVHIKVSPNIQPIYVLGKTIGGTDVEKGLSSMVDSSALKLLSTSAADVAHAICQHSTTSAHQHQVQIGQQDESSISSSSTGSSTRVAVNLTSEQQQIIMEQVRKRIAVLERCLIYSLCAD